MLFEDIASDLAGIDVLRRMDIVFPTSVADHHTNESSCACVFVESMLKIF